MSIRRRRTFAPAVNPLHGDNRARHELRRWVAARTALAGAVPGDAVEPAMKWCRLVQGVVNERREEAEPQEAKAELVPERSERRVPTGPVIDVAALEAQRMAEVAVMVDAAPRRRRSHRAVAEPVAG